MFLRELLKVPANFFKKDAISFLIIRRHDLGVIDDQLRYISVRPSASISVLRHKIWHLLDLPDYCEEVIVLKTNCDEEIPLTQLRHGNNPQHPYVLEVWLPGKTEHSNITTHNNMLTMGNGTATVSNHSSIGSASEEKIFDDRTGKCSAAKLSEPWAYSDVGLLTVGATPIESSSYLHRQKMSNSFLAHSTISNETMALNMLRLSNNKKPLNNMLHSDYIKSSIANKISSTSILSKLQCRKSRDNFTNILLKIQSDLSTLSNKLSTLEYKMAP